MISEGLLFNYKIKISFYKKGLTREKNWPRAALTSKLRKASVCPSLKMTQVTFLTDASCKVSV
jgi:hypothetical protein